MASKTRTKAKTPAPRKRNFSERTGGLVEGKIRTHGRETFKKRVRQHGTVSFKHVASSVTVELVEQLEQRYGVLRTQSIIEDLVRETFTYIATEGSAPPKTTELQALRQKNAASLAVLRAEVLRESLSSDEVKALINRSRPTVNKMAKEGELLAVPDGRAFRFPRWQFDENSETSLVPGLREVLAVMDASPLRKAAWFIRQNPTLENRRPVDVLRAGDVAAVLNEAKSLSPA
jgi:excisionase family DNA binding protein